MTQGLQAEAIETTIDPSARIDPTARIGRGVRIGPDVIVGPGCVVGDGTTLRARAIVVERTTLGERNDVHPYAVIGGEPQDRAYDPASPGSLIVGDANIFREGVTVSRSTGDEEPTRIGSDCFFMSASHVAHNCVVGDRVTMANGACLSGHARVGNGCVFSGMTGLHQFVHVGELVMFQAGSPVGMHVPPFVIVGGPNNVAGLNVVGLRRAGISDAERAEIKRVYRAFYRTRGARPMEEVARELRERSWSAPAERFIAFIEDALAQEGPRRRGVCARRERGRHATG